MIVWGLDVATRTGFAFGSAGAKPVSGSVVLKKPSEETDVACGNLLFFLQDRWRDAKPGLVAVEAPFSGAAVHAQRDRADEDGKKRRGSSEAALRLAHELQGVVKAMCHVHGVRRVEVYPQTWRRHFIGKGRLGSRDETKAAVIHRAHLLGLMPRESQDDNRADALGIQDWACATHARVPPRELHFFGETPR